MRAKSSNQTIRILFFGDVVGKPGRKALIAVLPELKSQYRPHLTIANAENLAHGVGVTKKTLDECRRAGVDFFTSGNHIWDKPEAYQLFEAADVPLLRPANYGGNVPGTGHRLIPIGTQQILVINLNGTVFIQENFSNPFHAIDAILEEHRGLSLAGTIVDLHAEATSEKTALGWYLDGRVSALLGTHTHIQTADERILPKGTAYITDVGMVGLRDSVIGVEREVIIANFLKQEHSAERIPDRGTCIINAVSLELDPTTCRAVSITRITKEVVV